MGYTPCLPIKVKVFCVQAICLAAFTLNFWYICRGVCNTYLFQIAYNMQWICVHICILSFSFFFIQFLHFFLYLSSSPPLFSSFFQVFQILPYFSIWTNPPPPGGEWPEYIYLAQYLPGTYQMILINGSDLNQWYLIQVVSAGSHPRWRCRRRRYWFPVYETSHPK